VKSTKIAAKKSTNVKWLVVIIVVGVILGYFYIRHEINHRLDSKIYAQLEEMDSQLDKLEQSAATFGEFKVINGKITEQVHGLTPKNYAAQAPALQLLIESSEVFAPVTAANFESLVAVTTDQNYKINKRQFKLEVRELKFGYNQQVKQFNQQIIDIGSQLSVLEAQVKDIDSSEVQALEQARIKFIRHKLKTVDEKIKANLLIEVLEDLDEPESAPVKN